MKEKFDTFDEAKAALEEVGFHEYPLHQFAKSECANFQRRYADDKGKKYFIDALVYDWREFNVKLDYNYSVSYKCQIYQTETHNAMNLDFIGWTLEDVENHLDKMFDLGLLDYYELWD